MKTKIISSKHLLRSFEILLIAGFSFVGYGQSGATLVSPKIGEIYYAGYELRPFFAGDSLNGSLLVKDTIVNVIALWDSVIVEWKYDSATAPRVGTAVIELSPDGGKNWTTFETANYKGNKTKLSSTKYRCRIDTTMHDIFTTNSPYLSTISENCYIRVYDYNNHSLGAKIGPIKVRRGPPPVQSVINTSQSIANNSFIVPMSTGILVKTLSVVRIISLSGKVVQTRNVKANTMLQLSDLSKGYWLVYAKNTRGNVNRHVFINN